MKYNRVNHSWKWKLHMSLCLLFPVFFIIVVYYESTHLQAVNDLSEVYMMKTARLRNMHHTIARNSTAIIHPSELFAQSEDIVQGRRTMILIASYRDSKRCAETLRSLFENAAKPDLLRVSIVDQISLRDGEKTCVESYCNLVGQSCRVSQVIWKQIDALDAKGPTYARYEAEEAVTDEDFCLHVDSHIVFVPSWDELIIKEWEAAENPNAIITVYPKPVDFMNTTNNKNLTQRMCQAYIESSDEDAMVQYGAALIEMKPAPAKPLLMSQMAAGFNFGSCRNVKEVRSDPYAPFLFHGEEYSKAARLWTSGYDFYVPRQDTVYHWYENRNVIWETNWESRFRIQLKSNRRIRYALGLPVTKMDFDLTRIEEFTLGRKRTFEQWKNFTGIDPLAPYAKMTPQFDNCRELEYVPYS
uniref:Uncharacterized protein AlNc14C59G4373 n=1 Tax=Albugo laibachii Nc14 TaxID=890382 RepID=F0WCJ3_9STRA|nr:conserved hypothetical protein [Albugo laibachii Nc14]|eukprot:CCA18910.1 conserved hypothetical protein [Albugo laibachii Nc14]